MRFTETEESIFFHKTGAVMYKSALEKYKNKTFRQIKKTAKKYCITTNQQKEIIHYLKEKGLKKNEQ